MKNTISISITDAQKITRNAIKHFLNTVANFEVTFDTDTGTQLISELKKDKTKPHICILEVSLPDLSGLETLMLIKKEIRTDIKVLMLSSYKTPITISKFLKNGANGYILKEDPPGSLIDAIHHVYAGGAYLPDVMLKDVHSRRRKSPDRLESYNISKKEYTFLSYCNSELTYKEIASKMFISPRTLEAYRDSLFRKLNVKSRTGLALYAEKSGIVYYQ